jgi:hypothetical protein
VHGSNLLFGDSFMSIANDNVRPFSILYEKVEQYLTAYVNNPNNPDRLSSTEKEWFIFLITNFRNEFRKWAADARLQPYLSYFRKGSNAYKTLGCAYLHIAYDLSRVIADSLKSEHSFASGLDLGRARGIYLQQAPAFFDMIEKNGTNKEIFGHLFSVLNWITPDRFSLVGVMGNWILALRTTAWVHAEILHSCTPQKRAALESSLLDAITQAANDVAGDRRNLTGWPRRLKPQQMLKISGYFILLQETVQRTPVEPYYSSQTALLWLITLIGVVVVVIGAYQLINYFKTVLLADRLGEAILYRMEEKIVKVLDPISGTGRSANMYL